MLTNPLHVLSLLGLTLTSFFAMHAQTAGATQSYGDEPYVVEHLADVYTMQADGTGVQEHTARVRVQSQAGLKQVSVLTFSFAANSQHIEWVYARLHHGDGSTTETAGSSAIEVALPVTREAPFYSDLKESQLPIRDLRVGDTIEWKVRSVRTVAEAPNEFWDQASFVREGVVLSQEIELRLPKDAYVNAWSPKFKPRDSIEGNTRTLHWESKRLEPTVGAAAEAAKAAEKKRLRTAAEELDDRLGRLPDVAWTTFHSWAEVGAWYRTLEGDRMVPDAQLRAKVAQLTAGKTTEAEKVQAVYAYVATQIHYIGVAFGIGRYQPHSAGDVLNNQYGDCKDKHTLLAAMLEALGLHPDAVLIGVGIRFNPEVPAPDAFNHLMTRVELAGQPVWLDTTAETAPFGMLVYPTRDHDALVVPSSGAAAVERTPARPPFPETFVMEATGKLDAEGLSESTITLAFRGNDEVGVRGVLRQVSPAQYDQLAKQLFSAMGYAGTGSLIETSRPEDTTTPIKLTLSYKRSKAGDWDNLRVIPQLYPVTLPVPDEKEPPVESIGLGIPRVETSRASMTLPAGWTAELPEAVHERSQWATYDLTYSFKDGTLHAERRIEVLEERVAVADWKAYAKLAERARGEKYVQLVRHAAVAGGKTEAVYTPEATGKTSDPEMMTSTAEKQVADALAALDRHDLSQASLLLDLAKRQKPEQPLLWLGYGYLSFYNGEISAAAKDFDKEATLHPSERDAYRMLANMQLLLKHRPETRAALERWAQAAPDDPEPVRQMANLALEDNKPEEAIRLLSPVVTHAMEDQDAKEQLLFLLGRAQLRAGKKTEADATLLNLLQTTDDAGMMNNVAFELADAGLELPAAEQVTRNALHKLEAESLTWTLDESLNTLVARTQTLQATWDTMGWIWFKQGKTDAAERYIHAAWLGRPDLEVGAHLGELALARGDKAAALTDFDMALDLEQQTVDALGARAEESPKHKQVTAQADELRKAGVKASTTAPKAALQSLRTIALGPGEDGVAEYKLLIDAHGSIVRAEPTETKRVANADALFRRAALTSFIPNGSEAHLVMVGFLNCHSKRCELMIER